MTPNVILGMMLAVAGRRVAGGLNNNELYIHSDIGITLFLGLRLLMYRLK